MEKCKSNEQLSEREFYREGCMCPACEVGNLHLLERELEFEDNGEKLILKRHVWECSECKESFFQAKDKRQIEKILTDRRRQVDGLLVSEEMQAIREQLHLTTAELAGFLRIPEQQLMYYENGQSTQSYELDDVLRILRDYPEAIQVLTPKVGKTIAPNPPKKTSVRRLRKQILYPV